MRLAVRSAGGFEIKPKGVDEYLTYVPPQQQGGRIPIKEKNFEEEEEEAWDEVMGEGERTEAFQIPVDNY